MLLKRSIVLMKNETNGILERTTRSSWTSGLRAQYACASALLLWATVGFLFGQGLAGSSHHPSYDLKRPLPLTLPEAYLLAIGQVGPATNRFYCITASCLEKTDQWSTGWTFSFLNTNAQRATVNVFFNKHVSIDPQSAKILK